MGFENIWEDLDLTAKANKAAFGIEYCLRGQADSARELLKDGKYLCQILLKASRVHRKDGISVQEIPLWGIYDRLVRAGQNIESGIKAAVVLAALILEALGWLMALSALNQKVELGLNPINLRRLEKLSLTF